MRRGFRIRPGKKSRRHGIGRVCAHSECDTRLSSYNPADRCYLHAPLRYARIRGRKERT
jgi:hypothetical protein